MPYKWGVLDCSWIHWRVRKLVMDDGTYSYATARNMADGINGWSGKRVAVNEVEPGDEGYYAFHDGLIDHVVSFFGDPLKVYHAPKTGDVVKAVEPRGTLITKLKIVKRPDWLHPKGR